MDQPTKETTEVLQDQFDPIAENEHKEKMWLMRFLQNMFLLLAFFILVILTYKWWCLFMLLMWDHGRSEKEADIVFIDETIPSVN